MIELQENGPFILNYIHRNLFMNALKVVQTIVQIQI